jgi:hypothetical protein
LTKHRSVALIADPHGRGRTRRGMSVWFR